VSQPGQPLLIASVSLCPCAPLHLFPVPIRPWCALPLCPCTCLGNQLPVLPVLLLLSFWQSGVRYSDFQAFSFLVAGTVFAAFWALADSLTRPDRQISFLGVLLSWSQSGVKYSDFQAFSFLVAGSVFAAFWGPADVPPGPHSAGDWQDPSTPSPSSPSLSSATL